MKKFFALIGVVTLMLVGMTTSNFAQSANDQYGFGNRVFLIQSALESGKTANGLWDVPGVVDNKVKGLAPSNVLLTKKNVDWKQMTVYQREPGDPADRVFVFQPGQGGSAGKYAIKFAKHPNSGVVAIVSTGKVEARTTANYFEFKYLGNGKWKIYTQPGTIICLETSSAKNGTKLVLRPDQNGPHTEWVFYDASTNQSFIPVEQSAPEKSDLTLDQVLGNDNLAQEYFSKVDAEKFLSENNESVLQTELGYRKAMEQWNFITYAVRGVKLNKDVRARRAALTAISSSEIKKGGNFAEKVLATKTAENLTKIAATEKDEICRKLINEIAEKMV
ncbi:MAG: hypothetical protein JW982_10855 [Spirochaetes bacterium]|nr:hypothetical protein [Spirochaetota bacterium]